MIVVSTRTEAEILHRDIESGAPFDALARARSIDPSSSTRGGFLGVLRVADLTDDLRDGLVGLGEDELSGVIPLGGDFALLDVLTDSETTWYAAMEEARERLTRGRFAEARVAFREALDSAELWPGDTRLAASLSGLATTFLREGRYARAEPLFRRALAIHEDVRFAGPNLGLLQSLNDLAGTIYRRGGDLEEVESLFARSLGISRDAFGDISVETGTALNNLALVVRDRGRYDEASELFGEALEIFVGERDATHPSVQATLDALAESHRLGRNLDEAETVARRSLEIAELNWGRSNSLTAAPLGRLADVLADQGREEQALELRRQALATRWNGGSDVVPMLDAFVDAMFAARFGEAESTPKLRDLDAMLRDAGEELHRAMGQLFLAGQFDREAAWVLRRAVERFPDSWLLQYALAEAYVEMQSFDEALAAFDRIQPESNRESSVKSRRTGDILASLSRYEEALAHYQRAIDADPDNVEAWSARGDLLLQTGDDDQAASSYEEALRRDPDEFEALTALANIRLLAGSLEESAALARRAIVIDDANRDAHYTLAQALLRSGRTAEGQESLNRFRALLESESERERRERGVTSIAATVSIREPDVAAEILRDGLETYPDATRVSLDLGLLEMRSGNASAAIAVLEGRRDRAIAGDFLVHRALEDAYQAVGRVGDQRRSRTAFLKAIGEALDAAVE